MSQSPQVTWKHLLPPSDLQYFLTCALWCQLHHLRIPGRNKLLKQIGGTLSLAAVYPLMWEQKTVNSILWLATPSSYFTGPACNIFQHTLLLMVLLLTDPTFVLKILRSHKENASSSEDKTVRHPNQAKRNASPWCSIGGPFFKFWSSGFGSEYVFKSVFPSPVFLNSHLKTL